MSRSSQDTALGSVCDTHDGPSQTCRLQYQTGP